MEQFDNQSEIKQDIFVTCPECGTKVGGDTGTDIYKHAVNCFHLPPRGAENIKDMLDNPEIPGSKEYRERVKFMMDAAINDKNSTRRTE